MCGICGYLNRTGAPASLDIVGRMNACIAHRGPDDSNEWAEGPAALAYRRLSIIDPHRGRQPMRFGDFRQRIVYNGEVYNHQELRRRLSFDPATFQTHCDTETVLAAYLDEGADCLHRFNGMFAFAVHQEDDDSLFLARDRLGIKPLYYFWDEKLFAFASEIKALLAHPEIEARVDHSRIPVYLTLKYPLDDGTLFRGIKRLRPGHYLRASKESVEIAQYWDLSFGPKIGFKSEIEAAEQFDSLLHLSVKRRLMSDAPLGAFLSGGIDSAYITSIMSLMRDRPIRTYSIGFSDRGYSEFRHSRSAAARARARAHETVLTADQWFSSWPLMVYHEDEPIAHPSSISLHHLSKLASRDVKVVLAGEGADELLAGYERYYQTILNVRLAERLPDSVRALARAVLDGTPVDRLARGKLTRTSLYLSPGIESLYLDNYAAFSRSSLRRALRRSESVDGLDQIYDPYLGLMRMSGTDELLDQILYADTKTYLAELLMKQDQMSMSASIEARVPFLDHELVEFVCRLPQAMKLRGFKTKRILRRAATGKVPAAIVKRRKMGFPTPTRAWFRGRYRSSLKSLLLSPKSLCHEVVDPRCIDDVLNRHASGKQNLEDQIWVLGNLELWLRIFVDGQDPHNITVLGESTTP